MKKILFMHHCSSIGGGSWCLLEIIQEIDRSNFKVEVVLGEDGPLREHVEGMGIDVHVCQGFPMSFIAHPAYRKFFSLVTVKQVLSFPRRISCFAQLFKKIKPDIVYLNSIIHFPIAAIAKRCGAACVVLHIREHFCLSGFDPRAWFWKRAAVRYVDRIVSISQCGAELAGVMDKARIARDWADFTTRGDEVAENIFERYAIPSDKPMVLLTGGSAPHKGSLSAVRAFLKLHDATSICVVLAGMNIQKLGAWGGFKKKMKSLMGTYPDWYELRKLAESSGRIYLLPSVLSIKQFMEAAKLVVCVYKIPHCAKPAIEAGLLSKVAIVADNPEGLEYVADGETGFVVPYGNIDLLAERMDAILSGSVDADAMGARAKVFVDDEFSKVKSMKAIMASIDG